jgi:cytochrome c oxidase subunit II
VKAPGWDEPALQSVLDAASPQARSIADLWWVFFWVSVVVWVLVVLFAGLAVARRRREPRSSEPVVNPGSERTLVRATGGATLVTLLILIGLLIASASTGRVLATPARPEALKIKVTGQRWWWQVEYPADLPSHQVTTANEIHVPVGRAVSIALDSRDVIHSLWIPELNGKRDLIPGNPTELHFVAEWAGVYRGQCAEFCGLQHAHMGLLVIAEPAAQFEAWLAAQRAPAQRFDDPLRQRGQQVFLSSSCPLCHGVRGTDAAGSVGPDLTHIASRSTLAAATLPNTPEQLEQWVRDPHAVKLGTLMPSLPLAPEDQAPLIAFLTGLK